MSENIPKNTEKSTFSDELEKVLSRLNAEQIKFVVARQEYPTDKEAAESIGVKVNTVYKWGSDVKEAIRLMAFDGLTTALHLRRRNLAKAMMIKVDGLDSKDEPLKQRVATEIIEWETGKASQPHEVSGGVALIGIDPDAEAKD